MASEEPGFAADNRQKMSWKGDWMGLAGLVKQVSLPMTKGLEQDGL